jgi:hypothetical protein
MILQAEEALAARRDFRDKPTRFSLGIVYKLVQS